MLRKAIAAVLVSAIALAGCGNGDENLAAPNTEVPIDVTITDPDFGTVIKATSLVRNVNPPPANSEIPLKRSELIAIKLDVTQGDQYNGAWRDLAMRVLTEVDGKEKEQTTVGGAQVEEVMNAAGRTPLKEVQDGASGSGWIMAYVEPKGTESITLRYGRLATDILGSSRSFPAKDYDAVLIGSPIPAASADN